MAVRYSRSEAIDAVRANDDNVSVRAYVDAVIGPKVVGSQRLNLFKFAINNGAGKIIQCLAWEDNIERVEEVVKMHKILLIEGAKATALKRPEYNIGNVPYELTINKFTQISVQGNRAQQNRENALPVTRTTWEEVADKEGETIEISGWVKSAFRQVTHNNNESSYGAGSISDGVHKLEIRLTSMVDLPERLEQGVSVKVIGTVHFTNYLHLKVQSGADITRVEDAPSCPDPEALIDVTGPPPKRQRRNE